MCLSPVPQVHEPQEVPSNRPLPQDGQGQQRPDTQKRVHRWHNQHQ